MAAQVSFTSTDVHPEDRELIDKLAKLQDIHHQIHDLRTLLPGRLLKPTRLALERPKGSSPDQVARHLSIAATQGSKDVRRFKKDFRSEEMQELWQKANTTEYPQGRDAWFVNYRELASAMAQGESTTAETDEDIRKVVETFSSENVMAKVEMASDSSPFPLKVVVEGLYLEISRNEKGGKQLYQVTGRSDEEPSETTKQVLASIAAHEENLTKLEVLLSMLASYHKYKTQHCEKCDQIFDDRLRFAFVRERKASASKDDKKIEWAVSHLNPCSP